MLATFFLVFGIGMLYEVELIVYLSFVLLFFYLTDIHMYFIEKIADFIYGIGNWRKRRRKLKKKKRRIKEKELDLKLKRLEKTVINKEKEEDVELAHFEITCVSCKETFKLEVDASALFLWRSGNIMIQDAFPTLSDDDRELLMTKTCGKCFDSFFKDLDKHYEM